MDGPLHHSVYTHGLHMPMIVIINANGRIFQQKLNPGLVGLLSSAGTACIIPVATSARVHINKPFQHLSFRYRQTYTGLFVNNISWYAKFPVTWYFWDIYQKTCDFLPEFFSGDPFLSTIPKNSHFQAECLTVLVIYHKNNQPILAMYARILYVLNVSLEKVLVRHD